MISKKDIFLNLMTWSELQKRLEETDTVLIPVGQTEQHGHHLPLEVDNYIAVGIAERVAIATYDTAKPVVAPTIAFGYSDLPEFRRYPGTFFMSPETLISIYKEVATSLVRMGFKKVIFINVHSCNPPFIEEAIRQLTRETKAFFALGNFLTLVQEEAEKVLKEMGKEVWGHACIVETSMSMVFGAEVREDMVDSFVVKPIAKELQSYFPKPTPGITIPCYEMPEIMESIWPEESPGPMGDPTGYSEKLGERFIKACVDPLVELVNNIKTLNVEIPKDIY